MNATKLFGIGVLASFIINLTLVKVLPTFQSS